MSDASMIPVHATSYADRLRVTAGDLLALMRSRKGHTRSAYLHVDRDVTAPHWRRDQGIFTLHVDYRPHARFGERPEVRTTIELPGWIGVGFGDMLETRTPNEGRAYQRYSEDKPNWHIVEHGYIHLLEDRLIDLLHVIPRRAVLSFRMRMDNMRQGPVAERLIHVDELDLEAHWDIGKKTERRACFLLDVSVGAHNSARFGLPVQR